MRKLPFLFTCALPLVAADAFAQSFASVIGWEGDVDAAITAPDGSYFVRDGVNQTVRFGIYGGTSLDWANCADYLPCSMTTFDSASLHVVITSFGDKVTLSGNDFVVIYSRVAITNNGTASATADPQPSLTPGLVALTSTSTTLAAGAAANHDYAIVVDRFGGSYARPADADLGAAGTWDAHYAHMQQYWSDRLSKIVQINALPEPRLIAAYKAGFIYTHIVKDHLELHVGENGYDQVFDHDLLGIMNSLFVLGDFQDAHSLLSAMPKYIYPGSQYKDASWKYSWPWATYLQKTGDLDFVKQNFAAIKTPTRTISTDRSGPNGIMGKSPDIDANGYWTSDDWAALLGLSTYQYVANAAGQTDEAQWAASEYDALFQATDAAVAQTTSTNGISYIPCSPLTPNTANRCNTYNDGNWMALSILGSWAWDGFLWNAPQDGTMLQLIDSTYDWGFGRLAGKLPAHTYGGYPGFSTTYNAGYGMTGLRGQKYRSEAILDYIFQIDQGQSGPFSWWENEQTPTKVPWKGTHPGTGGGACPHMWGQSFSFRALVDSLIAEKGDGTVVIGHGVPLEWTGQPIDIDNFAVAMGKRMGFTIGGTSTDVTLTLKGDAPAGNVIFDMPAFVGEACTASAGTVNRDDGTVTLPAGTTSVTVHLADTCDLDAGAPPSNSAGPSSSGSCGCRLADLAAPASTPTLAGAALGLLLMRRRRRT